MFHEHDNNRRHRGKHEDKNVGLVRNPAMATYADENRAGDEDHAHELYHAHELQVIFRHACPGMSILLRLHARALAETVQEGHVIHL